MCSEHFDGVDVARRDRRALRLYTRAQESPRAGQISGAEPQPWLPRLGWSKNKALIWWIWTSNAPFAG